MRWLILSCLLFGAALLSSGAAIGQTSSLSELSERELLDLIDEAPENGAARLEFARREFDRRRDDSANFNVRQALATGSLTPDQAQAARDILAALQRRRRWIFNFDASLAPATSRQEFFDPDPDNGTEDDITLQTVNSGVGVTGFGSVENRIPISNSLRWSSQIFTQGAFFTNGDFNSIFVSTRFGPLLLQNGDDQIGVRGIAEARWLGNELDFEAYGGEAFIQRSIGQRLVGFGRLTVRTVDDSFDSQDGETYSLNGVLTRFGPSGRFERVFTTVFRAELDAANQSFWFGSAGFGVFRETIFGLGILIEPSVSIQRFNGIDSVGGIARQDWRYGARGRLVKRDWRIFGTSPFVSLSVQRQESNINTFDTTRTTVNAGLTRTF